MKYNPKKIEPRWQKKWLEEKIYEPDLEKAERPFYNLMMFPYPSAEGLHVGNMYAFTGSDIYGRFKRMQGYDVFEPIGLDGFGIHAENYALKIKKNPAEQAKISEKNFYRQLRALGNGFAWDEKLETYDPDYYKWTQWIFTEMFRRGLAYRKKQAVNWCPSCKTVLADEQVVQKQIANSKGQIAKTGVCERCETPVVKRELEQWFFRITDYAERLLKDLGGLDWSEKVKVAQRNWIGKSEGALIKFEVRCQKLDVRSGMHIEVFTTRPDTLFGAAYVVLAPENPLITALELEIKNFPEVIRYIKKARAKKGDERLALGKVKTGVELKGIKAINPASKEEIPIWVADYVLGNVGTGAIMAVPAHDERDFEFAKRHALPIRQVIAPKFSEPGNPPRPGKRTIRRRTVHSIVRRVKDNKILMLQWKGKMWGKNPPRTFIIGGIEEGEDVVKSARREIYEETGYKNLRFVRRLDLEVHTEYFAAHKDENRYAEINVLYFELGSDEHDKVSPEELQKHEPIWIDEGKVGSFVNVVDGPFIWNWFKSGGGAYAGNGVLINSEKFSGQDSENATLEITKFVKGERKVQYRLRDWLISRQRYWGPPIPMIFCEACFAAKKGERKEMPGWYAVPEKGLPVALPKIKDFRPKGKGVSPLATEKSFYEVKCPSCGGKARRETDVSDTFLDSAWYYIAYLAQIANRPPALLRNAKRAGKSQIANPFSNPRIRKWLPIDMYIGGAEHSVLH
ncbi:MAG: class I tRNA ligase family protein, partial [Candidatus Liptonbacteria bacterium]|nr:class I tRNA ligase family protein [Candidatus Liptonbacteria bacterium]